MTKFRRAARRSWHAHVNHEVRLSDFATPGSDPRSALADAFAYAIQQGIWTVVIDVDTGTSSLVTIQ